MEESEGIILFQTLIPLAGLAVIIVLGVVLIVFQFQRSLFHQRLKQEDLKATHQQELLRNAITVQEQERQRIANDLHDDLGARLSFSLMQLKQLQDIEAKCTISLSQLEAHLEEALASTKRISYELMPPQLTNLGLYKALLVLIDDARTANSLQISINKLDGVEQLSWPAQLGIYRMVSEMLNNTLKHAEATEVSISLKLDTTSMQCSYCDNGKGLPKAIMQHGLGLKSLEGRATALNGTFTINPTEFGFSATITIPISTAGTVLNPNNSNSFISYTS